MIDPITLLRRGNNQLPSGVPKRLQDAVVRNLQIMAESSQRLSDEEKSKHPAIPWRDIAGFRNILVHDYLGLDLDIIWSVVEQDLPSLRDALKAW